MDGKTTDGFENNNEDLNQQDESSKTNFDQLEGCASNRSDLLASLKSHTTKLVGHFCASRKVLLDYSSLKKEE